MNYRQEYYQKNKEKELLRVKAKQAVIRKWYQEYKTSRGCCRCGYSKCAGALQFHHTGEETKEFTIARMVGQGRSPDAIMAEAEKCIILCANCHAEEHWGIG